MKYIKFLFSFVLYTILLFVMLAATPFFAIFEGKKAFSGFLQIFSVWKLLLRYVTVDTRRVTEPYKLKLYGKYKEFKNTEYITINFNDFDLFEILIIGWHVFTLSFYVYILSGALYSALIYTAIYENPSAEVRTEPVKKPVITYQKLSDEINIDTYCPCDNSFNLKKEDLKSSLNTLIIDKNTGELKVSKQHQLSDKDFSESKREYSEGEIVVLSVDEQIKFTTQDETEIKVNAYQGFVFSFDLYSIFYFNKEGELFRISKQ